MELRHLRYFVAVAEELNYRRAAARLFIAAPPLSVQIKHLEQEIGVALFARQGRGIKLTEGGHAFLDQARKTLASANRGIAVARQAANGEIGHLSIGLMEIATTPSGTAPCSTVCGAIWTERAAILIPPGRIANVLTKRAAICLVSSPVSSRAATTGANSIVPSTGFNGW